MNFFDILPKTSYNEETKNYVASFIMDYFSDSKSHNIYLISKNFGFNSAVKENIFLIQKTIQLPIEPKQVKIVRILIYIPTNFPNAAPKFFLDKAENYAVVEVQKNIDKSTYEITLKSISEWKSIDDFNRILGDIITSFNKFYPFYKLELDKRKGIVYPQHSFVPSNALKISLNGVEQINAINQNNNFNEQNAPMGQIATNINSQNNIYNINNPNMNSNFIDKRNFNQPANANFHKSLEDKVTFSDEEIKKILMELTILDIKEKFLQNYYENKKIKVNLDEMKSNKILKINEIGDKIVEGKKILNAFDKLHKDLYDEIANIKDNIIAFSRVHLSFENFRNFIEIPAKEECILKLISMESTLEDFIFSLKKSFEKNNLTSDETMKNIRKISKEIFAINFLKKKLIQERYI